MLEEGAKLSKNFDEECFLALVRRIPFFLDLMPFCVVWSPNTIFGTDDFPALSLSHVES